MLTGDVLVTGGAGYLARGLYRRARREGWTARFTCLSRDDAKHAALQRRFPEVECVVADVGLTDAAQLTDLMRGFDTVIHAAAWKYVDRGEHEARATIETNVLGSLKVAESASRARVRQVIGISTDKAVAPVNTYGGSKFLMERIFQEANRRTDTTFTVVRYGNVVGSTGSVIPTFMDAAREGRPIRLTDPEMTRFWMSIDEAVDTVLAGLAAPGGTVVVPACRSMTMHDLTLMALGYDRHEALPEDGRVEIIGVRPGEKRHEALVQMQESVRAQWAPAATGDAEGRGRFVQIAPPDSAPRNDQPFELRSDDPPRGWMGLVEMRAIIADAEQV